MDTIALQFWPTERVWLKGGVGFGRISLSDNDGNQLFASEYGGGAMGAVGFELLWSGSFAFDVQVRVAAAKYDDITVANAYLLAGANWY